jgi:ABC-type Fe3+-hydroxamate transport system substrate-binding protein
VKDLKKIIPILLAAALRLLCACGNTAGISAGEENDAPAVTDGAGRRVAIPGEGEKITVASVYAVSVPFLVALRLTPSVVAVNCKSNFWTNADGNLAAAGSVGRGVVDLEALAEYDPTVLLHRANDAETVEAVTRLGIGVLCISAEDVQGVRDTLTLMGRYFGAEERAAEVIGWFDAKFEKIDGIVSTIPEDERVSAVVMGSRPGIVAGGDMLQSFMIEKAGGISCSDGVENDSNWANVGVEKVFEWNPDYLFCTSSAVLDYTVDTIMEDKTWSAMNAVKNGRLAVIPAKIDSWDLPGIVCCLGTMWMLNRMYPDYFSAGELEAEIEEYYTFMFGQAFDAEVLGYDLDG